MGRSGGGLGRAHDCDGGNEVNLWNDGIRNAIIESWDIRIERGFILDAWLHLKYDDSMGQGFGGWSLYLDKTASHHTIESVAGHHLFRIMEIAGVERIKDLSGKAIRANVVDGKVVSVGHIINDDWYTPAEDFGKVKK
jgi:hypothetical protein